MSDKSMTARASGGNEPNEAHLWVCSGKNVGRRYRVDNAPRILGRAHGCDIVVEDERASQRHAQLQLIDGGHVIEDLGSTNGTYVNNQRVHKTGLKDGDLVQVGETIFEYLSSGDQNFASAATATDHVPRQLQEGAQQMIRRARDDRSPPPGNNLPVPMSQVHRHDGGQPHVSHPPAPYSPGGGQLGGQYGGHYAGQYQAPEAGYESSADVVSILARISHVVRAFLPYWPIAVAFTFVGVMLGALHFKVYPPPNTANFEIVVNPTGVGGLGPETGNIEIFKDLEPRFRGFPIIERALEKLTGKKPTPLEVTLLSHRVNFYRIGQFNSNMYGGNVEVGTGDFAVRYLRTHLNLFLEQEIDIALRKVKAQVGFFNSEIENASKALEEAEERLVAYKRRHPDALPAQVNSQYTAYVSLQQQLRALEQNISSAQASLRENQKQLSSMQRYLPQTVITESQFKKQLDDITRKLIDARAAGKGDRHPDVIKLKQRQAELQNRERNSGGPRSSGTLSLNQSYVALDQAARQQKAQLKALRQQKLDVEAQLARQQKVLDGLPKAQAEYEEIVKVYDDARKHRAALLSRLRAAELQLDQQRAVADAQYQVVSAPRIVIGSLSKARQTRLALGGVGGLFVAFLLATALVLRSKRLNFGFILGREIDLSVLFQDPPAAAPAGAHPPASGPSGGLGAPQAPPVAGSLPAPRQPPPQNRDPYQ